MSRRIVLALGFLASPLLCGASRPPVFESLDLTLVTLNRLRLQPVSERVAGLLPPKSRDLPASVRVYLKPTGQVDFFSSVVERAAARIRRAVAPGSSAKNDLRDSRKVARAVGLWLDTHVTLDPGFDPDAGPCIDQRMAYPKVSEILKDGRTDQEGRALAALALLRSLKVPARVATARGVLEVQYWVAAKAKATARVAGRGNRRSRLRKTRLHRPKPVLGWWENFDPGVRDYEIDGWSLDASGLARLRWTPKQELTATLVGWERSAFAQDDSPAAHAAFDGSLSQGALTATAQARSLTAAADAVLGNLASGESSLWVLTVQHWRLKTEGAMLGMRSVQIETPYRPDLPDWGREQRGPVLASDVEAQGVWSDRPQLLRLHKDLQDEWSSPPPALGILHWYDLGVRSQTNLLQATWGDGGIEGVALRSDNLAPRQGWRIAVSAAGTTASAQALVGQDGRFSAALSPALARADCLDVVLTGPEQATDQQRLLLHFH